MPLAHVVKKLITKIQKYKYWKYFLLMGLELESATNRVLIIVPILLSFVCKEQGEVLVRNSMLTDKIERGYSLRPEHLK